MSRRAEIIVHLDGPLLVGGYASPIGDLDATTATDPDGVPVIPASTLKGALREACTRIARGEDEERACTIDRPCNGTCIVCQIFGGPGADTEEILGGSSVAPGCLGGIFIGDAHPRDAVIATVLRRSLQVRPGVGIDRHTRSAVPQVFYEREVLDAPGQQLIAPLRDEGVSEKAWELFACALRLVDGIGNSRSRGFGRVHLELGPVSTERPRLVHVFPAREPAENVAILEIEALEPLVLGGLPSVSSLLDSASFITGAALRGALGTAAARLGTGEGFQRVFVDPKTCLLFSDAYPATPKVTALPVPVPRSSLACKHEEGRGHPSTRPKPRDGLLALALAPWLEQHRGGSIRGPRCACGSPLRSARGLHPPASPIRRVVTRLARDVYTGSAMPEMLYTTTQIDAGTRFVGTVARLGAEALEALRALAGEEIHIGRGRRRGQGRVRLTIREDTETLGTAAVGKRLSRYAYSIRDAFELLGQRVDPPLRVGGAIAVLARTDLAIAPARAPDEILQELYGDHASRARCAAVAQAAGTRSGWTQGHGDERPGQRPLRPVVLAGSAWLFVHEDGATPDAEHLSRLETHGMGKHLRELGFGRLAIAHELFVD